VAVQDNDGALSGRRARAAAAVVVVATTTGRRTLFMLLSTYRPSSHQRRVGSAAVAARDGASGVTVCGSGLRDYFRIRCVCFGMRPCAALRRASVRSRVARACALFVRERACVRVV